MINISRLENLMKSKGWSEPMLANELGIDYSYLYRLLRGKRNAGKKVYDGIFKLCQREHIDIEEFIIINSPPKNP